MPRDVTFSLRLRGGGRQIPITPIQLRNAGKIFLIEIRKQFRDLAHQLVRDLEVAYELHGGGRRVDGGPELVDRIIQAIRYVVEYGDGAELRNVNFGVLNLPFERQATLEMTQTGRVLNVFDLVEDDHQGLEHGSSWFGFLSLEYALKLATECVENLGLDEAAASDLEDYVRTKMAGRYGVGIMVRLDRPVFFAYPEFGTAIEHGIEPHPGFTSWHVAATVLNSQRSMVPSAIDKALSSTETRLLAGAHR